MTTPNWKPILEGPSLLVEPLAEGHREALFQAACDPLIWELHPVPGRYTREGFMPYFDLLLTLPGSLVIRDKQLGGKVIGTSSYYGYEPETRRVVIGYTFIDRAHWGDGTNTELKKVMLKHAFQWVEGVEFHVAVQNLRSQKAVEKLGAHEVRRTHKTIQGIEVHSIVFELKSVY